MLLFVNCVLDENILNEILKMYVSYVFYIQFKPFIYQLNAHS